MDEMEALRAELAHYKAEKDKIRDIVGQIGGKTGRHRQTVINIVFLTLVAILFGFDLLRLFFDWEVPFLPPLLLLEVAVLLVSLKIVWMIHTQSKVDHFQFWILHSIEFQMNMLSRRVTELSKALDAANRASRQRASDGEPAGSDRVIGS
jgi:hypothetical protein